MSAARFNPLTYANTLEAAGFNRAQAEALAQGFFDLRFDMQEMEERLRAEMAALRKEIADSKVETIRWMVGLWLLQTSTLIAVFKLFA
ncbi:MAG TPA: hypothetical protein VFG03_11850 [Telluria sp.]|nr:hypothetical protein [Telluria sp.]